jgi:hypothetical protein
MSLLSDTQSTRDFAGVGCDIEGACAQPNMPTLIAQPRCASTVLTQHVLKVHENKEYIKHAIKSAVYSRGFLPVSPEIGEVQRKLDFIMRIKTANCFAYPLNRKTVICMPPSPNFACCCMIAPVLDFVRSKKRLY